METVTRNRIRTIVYWLCTALIGWEMAAGSMWDLLQIPYVRAVFDRLSYPHYLLLILGVWKLPCAIALLVPRYPRLKEWAYAGAFFNYSGAAASHALAGDRGHSIGAAIFALITLGSWALRPADRRLSTATPIAPARVRDWIISLGVIAAFVVIALLTLPKGT